MNTQQQELRREQIKSTVNKTIDFLEETVAKNNKVEDFTEDLRKLFGGVNALKLIRTMQKAQQKYGNSLQIALGKHTNKYETRLSNEENK